MTAIARIFCIGRNYAEHARELGDEPPGEPVVFMKPWTCLLPPGGQVRYPPHGRELHHEAELVVRVGRGGRDIPARQALDHLDAVTLGLDLTLRDVQRDLKRQGLPWEKAKAFEGAAPLGQWVPLGAATEPGGIGFRCLVNGELRQRGHGGDMLFPVPELIAHLSGIWTLVPGDLVFTGTPAGVGPLVPGDRVVLESEAIGTFAWDVVE